MRHGLKRAGVGRFATFLLISTLLVLSVAGTAVAADHWNDITDAQWLSTYGVTAAEAATVAEGFPDGSFRPYVSVTRGQFSKMAVNGLGLTPFDPAVPSFSDVPKGSTFYTFVEGAAVAGVINGYPDGSFKPGNSISRQQANSMMGRVLSDAEIVAQGSITGELGSYPTLMDWYEFEGAFWLGAFVDRNEVDVVHRPTTAYLIYHEVVVGSNQRLSPTSTLQRAQAVAMVLRTLDAVEDVTYTTPPPAPTDMTTTPTSPSANQRPIISGDTTVAGGEVILYDTFNSTTVELARTIAEADGDFLRQVPADKALAEGLHLISAKVKDSHDRLSDPSVPLQYRVDLTAPTVEITEPEDDEAVQSPKPDFSADVTDSGSGVATVVFQYAVDATTPTYVTISTDTSAPYEAVWPTSGLPADGEYLFRVVAADRAGNEDASDAIEVLLDRVAPEVEIEEIEHDLIIEDMYFVEDRTPLFAAEADDPAPAAGVEPSGIARVDFYYALETAVPDDPTTTAGFTLISSDTVAGYSADWGARQLPDGEYYFAVRSVDKAGNTSELVHQEVVVDNAPPVVDITAPGEGSVLPGGEDFTVTWTATDVYFAEDPIMIEFSDDDGETWETLVAAMANTGSYLWDDVPLIDASECYLRITATDAMGNTTPEVSGEFAIDSTEPEPPTDLMVSDPDLTHFGIDGRDFQVDWTPSTSADVIQQEIYILPSPASLDLDTDDPVAVLPENEDITWIGPSSLTRDSNGVLFSPTADYDIWVVAVDAGGNRAVSVPEVWIALDPMAPVTPTAIDPDDEVAGVTGEDFYVTWTVSGSEDVLRQEIYILPDTVTLNLATHHAVATINDNETGDWEGPHSLTVDSDGDLLAAGDYLVYIVAVSDNTREAASEGAPVTAVAP